MYSLIIVLIFTCLFLFDSFETLSILQKRQGKSFGYTIIGYLILIVQNRV